MKDVVAFPVMDFIQFNMNQIVSECKQNLSGSECNEDMSYLSCTTKDLQAFSLTGHVWW